MRVLIRILALSLVVAAVVRAEEARLPSVTLPPALDRVLRDYERAWHAKDAAALAALFTGLDFDGELGEVRIRAKAGADDGAPEDEVERLDADELVARVIVQIPAPKDT